MRVTLQQLEQKLGNQKLLQLQVEIPRREKEEARLEPSSERWQRVSETRPLARGLLMIQVTKTWRRWIDAFAKAKSNLRSPSSDQCWILLLLHVAEMGQRFLFGSW